MPRTQQKARTRAAIVAAARELAGSGGEVTMPAVAATARVSEATAYRYFPDLVSLLAETLEPLDPVAALGPAAGGTSGDAVADRVALAAEVLARNVLAREGAVRAMIAGTVARPLAPAARPGFRVTLIEHALAGWSPADPALREALVRDLLVVIGAEALFSLLDLGGLDREVAVDALVDTARTITAARVGAAAPTRPATPRAPR